MTEETLSFEPTDTKKLQLKSLDAFAKALGYDRMHWNGSGHGYYSRHKENKHISNISIRTMCRLHNGQLLDWHGKYFRPPFTVDAYKMRVAQASKIIHRVKLMYQKKTKRGICQDHNVSFVDPQYEQLFLGGSDE